MKIILAILCLALAAQAAVERDSYQVMKEMAANLKPMIQAVLKDMPTTAPYRKIKQDWQNVLSIYDEHKDGEKCIDKVNRIIQAFGNTIRNYLKRNTNEVEKEMLRLFNQHGFEVFTDKYGQMLQSAKNPEYELNDRC
ncbi:uncharacterized protein LOC106093558 [Stomoxys calcitrans]|uniref:uncharacterized protein LOC106093558 n=1 Tax=Stomoxys calcitrans TaxID=35570 RepID=UPI0027E2C40D|nr:uncharacterized protein LOC106093558 [Stomoxys calcitrans]